METYDQTMVKPMRMVLSHSEEVAAKDNTLKQIVKCPWWPHSNKYSVCYTHIERNDAYVSTTGSPLHHRHMSLVHHLGWDTLCGYQKMVQDMVAEGGGVRDPRRTAYKNCDLTVLLATEGQDRVVATAAVDSFKVIDMVVWELAFTTMVKLGVPAKIWKMQAWFVFHLKRVCRQGQWCGEFSESPEWRSSRLQLQSCPGCVH